MVDHWIGSWSDHFTQYSIVFGLLTSQNQAQIKVMIVLHTSIFISHNAGIQVHNILDSLSYFRRWPSL